MPYWHTRKANHAILKGGKMTNPKPTKSVFRKSQEIDVDDLTAKFETDVFMMISSMFSEMDNLGGDDFEVESMALIKALAKGFVATVNSNPSLSGKVNTGDLMAIIAEVDNRRNGGNINDELTFTSNLMKYLVSAAPSKADAPTGEDIMREIAALGFYATENARKNFNESMPKSVAISSSAAAQVAIQDYAKRLNHYAATMYKIQSEEEKAS